MTGEASVPTEERLAATQDYVPAVAAPFSEGPGTRIGQYKLWK